MTGYGIAEQTFNEKKISIEIKTLNSKQLDLNVKLPNELRSAELDLRNRIGAKLQRGKVDVVVTITNTDLAQTYHIDPDIVKAYKEQMEAISSQLALRPWLTRPACCSGCQASSACPPTPTMRSL